MSLATNGEAFLVTLEAYLLEDAGYSCGCLMRVWAWGVYLGFYLFSLRMAAYIRLLITFITITTSPIPILPIIII
jgi:hypothetical protein